MDRDNQLAQINNVCLVILSSTAIAFALIYTRPILVPFVIAFFIFSILSPFIHWFEKKLKVNHLIAVTITLVLFLSIFASIFLFLGSSLGSFFQSASMYKEKIIALFGFISEKLLSFNIDINNFSIAESLKELPLFSMANNLTGGIFSFVGNSALVVVFVLFMVLGDRTSEKEHSLVEKIKVKIGRYVGTKMITSCSTGLLIMLLLGVCRVELAFMFGVLTMLLNFIPNIGSIIASLLPLPVIFLQYGLGWQFYVVLILSALIQFIIGNIIEPKMVGDRMDLHPVVILIFLMFWGMVWGIAGMFMAVPITAILKIILSKIETTKKFSELLAGRF